MKKILYLFFTIANVITISAQTINWSKTNSNVKADSIAKEIFEPVQYLITYNYTYVRDVNFPDDKREGLTILQVGNRYNRFCDFNELRFDSICDETARGHLSVNEASPLMLSALKYVRFNESIVIDKQTNQTTIQRTAGLKTKRYQYSENNPTLEWAIQEGDTIIAGYQCKKAKTRLFGRDYIAWYSPEINMPYGPYKFNGLPGLILKVTDTDGYFDFMLNGFQKADKYSPIYMWNNKDIIKTTRKKVRQIYKNYCADPVSALASSGNVRIPDNVKATVEPKPYNPIELE